MKYSILLQQFKNTHKNELNKLIHFITTTIGTLTLLHLTNLKYSIIMIYTSLIINKISFSTSILVCIYLVIINQFTILLNLNTN